MEETSKDSQAGAFKLPKFKVINVRPEVLKSIQFHANVNMDQMFDKNFGEDEQGSGYHAFKELCLMQQPLMKDYDDMGYGTPGYYLLQRVHPVARQRAIDCAREIRKLYKIYHDE